jgi:hypothetical protein
VANSAILSTDDDEQQQHQSIQMVVVIEHNRSNHRVRGHTKCEGAPNLFLGHDPVTYISISQHEKSVNHTNYMTFGERIIPKLSVCPNMQWGKQKQNDTPFRRNDS